MATTSNPARVIYSIGEGSTGNPSINKAVEERIKELLEKFKDSQGIIYVNIEKLSVNSSETHRGRSRSISRDRSRSRSRSKSRSRSRSGPLHRRSKHYHKQHGKGHRFPSHFLHRRHHHPHHHHGGHHYPPYYWSSEVDETNCEVTTGPETTEEYRAVEPCCRGEGRRHRRWHRKNSRSRSRGGRSRSRSKDRKNGKSCQKKTDNLENNESEEQNIIMIDGDEPTDPRNRNTDLEKQFDNLNVSKSS